MSETVSDTARGRRTAIVLASLAVASVALIAASLAVGDFAVPLPALLRTLVGRGDPGDQFIVLELRLPRVALGIVVAVGFALSGAVFQTLLSNPLASPDVIGITGGASAAAVGAILLGGLSGLAVAGASFAGALVVAGAIVLLTLRSGIGGYRFVLIGIGFAFIVRAVLGYLLTRSDVRDAQSAMVWLVGSLGSPTWSQIAITGACTVVLVAFTALLARRLRMLQLGDDVAAGLGVPVAPSRLLLIAVAVGLAAVATAAAGPVAFVPFVAAPIARRLVGSAGLALVASALVGVVIVLASDFVAQHLLPGGLQVPVGIVTGVIGTPYLIWILARSNRR